MIKVKVNNEYKDVVKIFCGGTLQKEIVKVWSREAQEYVYESSVEYSGSLPITISANGDALLDYRIYGADGGVGEPTENLFDEIYSDTYKRVSIFVGEGNFTLSSTAPLTSTNLASLWLMSGYDTTESSSNRVFAGNPMTVQSQDGYVTVVYRKRINLADHETMLNAGTHNLPYEPYGYKLPMTVQSTNLFDGEISQGAYATGTGNPMTSNRYIKSSKIRLDLNGYITLAFNCPKIGYAISGLDFFVYFWTDTDTYIGFFQSKEKERFTVQIPEGALYFAFSVGAGMYGKLNPSDISDIMLVEGSVPLPYQPYSNTTTPVYIGENQLDAGEYVSYGEQKIYKRTENLFELLDDMKDAKNWNLKMAVFEAYFIYYHLSPEQLTYLKNVGTVYGKAFKKEGGQYINGTVLAITNKELSTGVDTSMRLILNNGAINNYIHDFTQDVDAYLCIGYGPGITEETKQFFVDAILNNFDIMLSSTAPTSYIPYVAPTDPPVPLPEIPTIKGETVIDYDGDPKPSQMYIKYRR